MADGIIYKALSGFYYVKTSDGVVTCRARGKFRKEKNPPLVGDLVEILISGGGEGSVEKILPRKNSFIRPSVANVDQMVIIASGAIPVTDPFLIDRIALIAVLNNCRPIICINKCDLEPADELQRIYAGSGFHVITTSAKDGTGIEETAPHFRWQNKCFYRKLRSRKIKYSKLPFRFIQHKNRRDKRKARQRSPYYAPH